MTARSFASGLAGCLDFGYTTVGYLSGERFPERPDRYGAGSSGDQHELSHNNMIYSVEASGGASIGSIAVHTTIQWAAATGGAIAWTGAAAGVAVILELVMGTGGVKVDGYIRFGLYFSDRFQIGDRIYFQIVPTERYHPERVRAIYFMNGAFWYDCRWRELVAEKNILSPDEYEAYVKERASEKRRLVHRRPPSK